MAVGLDAIIALLVQALREPLKRKELAANFQDLVWAGLDPSLPKVVTDVLRQLAYDLEFFEPNPSVRAEDGSYYGHRRFEEDVRSALAQLRDVGIDVGGSE